MTNTKGTIKKGILGAILFALILWAFPVAAHAKTLVWIKWGQSLMSSGNSANIPASMTGIPENCEIWTSNDGTMPVRSDSFASQSSFGPEVGFAWAISQAMPGDYHVIIRYAVPGTGMNRWQVGGDLYENLIEAVRGITAGRHAKIAAVMSIQGENETADQGQAALYYSRMEGTIRGLRKSFHNPKLPYIIGIVSNIGWDFTFEVAEAELQLVTVLPAMRALDFDMLPKITWGPEPNLHLTDASEIQLGSMFAYVVGLSGLCR